MKLKTLLLENRDLKRRALEFQARILEHVHDADVNLESDKDSDGPFIRLVIRHPFLNTSVYIDTNEYNMDDGNGNDSHLGTTLDEAFDAFYPSCMCDSIYDALDDISVITDKRVVVDDNRVTLMITYECAHKVFGTATSSVNVYWSEERQVLHSAYNEDFESVAAACAFISRWCTHEAE